MSVKKNAKIALFKFIVQFKNHHRHYQRKELGETKKILIIRQDNRIGNILFTTSLIKLIHQHTNVSPDIIVGEKFSELLANNQSIENIYIYKQKQFLRYPWQFFKFLKILKNQEYDLVIDCKSSFSFNNAFLTLFTNARQKIGFTNSLSHSYLDYSIDLNNDEAMHESVYLAQPFISYFKLNCAVPAMSYNLGHVMQNKINNSMLKIVGIHIGGRNEKSICPQRVNKICEALQSCHTKVLIIYGPDEIEKVNRIINRSNLIKVFPESMDQLARTINSTDMFITPDTGPLHIASALNKRIIAVFNTNNQVRYGPRSQQPSLTIHMSDLSAQRIASIIRASSKKYGEKSHGLNTPELVT